MIVRLILVGLVVLGVSSCALADESSLDTELVRLVELKAKTQRNIVQYNRALDNEKRILGLVNGGIITLRKVKREEVEVAEDKEPDKGSWFRK